MNISITPGERDRLEKQAAAVKAFIAAYQHIVSLQEPALEQLVYKGLNSISVAMRTAKRLEAAITKMPVSKSSK